MNAGIEDSNFPMIPNSPLQTEKSSEEHKKLEREILERMVGYITAAFGLVAGLAWNEAIQSFIQYAFPMGSPHSLWAKIIYAVIITIAVTLVTIYFTRLMTHKPIDEEEDGTLQRNIFPE